MKRTVVIATLAAVILLTGSAAGDQRTVTDPNDTGRFLDIASVSHDHGKRPDGSWRFHHTITMQDPWRSKRLCRTSALWIDVRDTNRRIVLFWGEGHLEGRIYNRNMDKHETIGRPAVWRSDSRSIDVAIRPRLLGHIDGDYRYEVGSSASTCHCPDGIRCESTIDRVPNKGYIRHEL